MIPNFKMSLSDSFSVSILPYAPSSTPNFYLPYKLFPLIYLILSPTEFHLSSLKNPPFPDSYVLLTQIPQFLT